MFFANIFNKIKEMMKKVTSTQTVENALKISPIISSEMANAIQLWSDMYENKAPWLHLPTARDPVNISSLGLPAFIASEKARMVVLEMKSEITTPMIKAENSETDIENEENKMNTNAENKVAKQPVSDTRRAEYLNKQYKKLLSKIRVQLEYGIALGGLVIKPYVVLNEASTNTNAEQTTAEIEFDYIHADGFFPLSFDGSGKVTEAAFLQTKTDKDTVYTRLEHHKLDRNTVTVTNRAFKSNNTSQTSTNSVDIDLGKEIPLTEVPEWASIAPQAVIQNVDRLLFAYFKMPEANTIDRHSPLGVSGFSRAVKLIKEADKQYSRMLWEFEGGELAIDVDRDALRTVEDSHGNDIEVLNVMQQRLYRKMNFDEGESTYNVFNPPFRDDSLINGLNNILMHIEDVTALSRGTLSDVAAEARTATELKILKQRSYSANDEIQKALEKALKDTIYVMNVYCTLYNITPEGEYAASFEWDDSIITDVDTELGKRITLMQNGLASKLENRMWYFGETEEQAAEALKKIDEENKFSMEETVNSQFEE